MGGFRKRKLERKAAGAKCVICRSSLESLVAHADVRAAVQAARGQGKETKAGRSCRGPPAMCAPVMLNQVGLTRA